jgi:SAM-dependent methyltransferase
MLRVVEATTQLVRDYWEERPCASGLTRSQPGSRGFFAEVEEAKNRLEPFEAHFADYPRWVGKDVLEIGCGVGTDTVRFARAGACITAVDLTEADVELAGCWLELEHLEGRVIVADGERLPFDDGSFDLVYSWGVIHHSPRPELVVAEIRRVLRPGGEVRAMIYARHSWFGIAVWLRAMLRRRRLLGQAQAVAGGLESPGTRAYSAQEARALFAGFAAVELGRIVTPYDRRVAGPLARALPAGWFLTVAATVG